MAASEAAEAAALAPYRFVVPHFLSSKECKELEFIHKSCGVFGYRPFVLSTTMSHLVATNCAHLIIPIISVRERVKEAVEQYFGREYELFVEFTGLISWTKGANIGWHSDDNRSYLRQRHYSAVCYLNTYENDFKGGLFHFQEGEPSTIIPSLGTLVIYTADERNVHCVDEVTEGERFTLALWFTSDRVHDEDQKLIQQIFTAVPDLQTCSSDDELEKVFGMSSPKQKVHHPVAASSAMYSASNSQNEPGQLVEGNTVGESANPYFNTANDLRVVRLALMGLSCRFSCTSIEFQHEKPVVLAYNHYEVPRLFSCSLEALQVAQFHQFRKAMMKNRSSGFGGEYSVDLQCESMTFDADTPHSPVKARNCTSQKRDKKLNDEAASMESLEVPNKASVSPLNSNHEDWDDFLDSVQQFEAYTSHLCKKLFQFFPSWRTTRSLTLMDP